MKICHIITRMIVGGAQENTLYSAIGAVQAGHECTLLTGPSEGAEGALLEHFAKKADADYSKLHIEVCPYLTRELSPITDAKAYFYLKKYLKDNRFDVVHTHSSKAGILGRLAARAAGVPVVVHTIHGLAFHPREKWHKNKIYVLAERIAAKHCDKIYAVAEAMIRQSLAEKIGKAEQYQVVYSGMEIGKFLHCSRDMDLRKKLNLPENACVLGTVARLFPLKGYEELMAIAPDLVRKYPNLHFLFVGDGILTETIKKQASEAGIADHIVFAGLISPENVPDYIAQMDILVHFSLREGLPRAAVQSLAAGNPVVAYPLDGTPEVVLDGKTGFLCPVGDKNAILNAISKLVENPELRRQFGKSGQALVGEKFDWHKMSNDLLASYQKLLEYKK